MRFIILGGGCYGTFYAQQLLRARSAGALQFDGITIVDHGAHPAAAGALPSAGIVQFARLEWDDFFDRHMEAPEGRADLFVPSPFNPHLGLGWLMRALAREFPVAAFGLERFSEMPGTPFQEQRDHGTLVASHADWICPVHCIEPETCPRTKGPRFWDMDRTGRELAGRLSEAGQNVNQVHLFHCHHVSYGVGGYPVAELLDARTALRAALSAGSAEVRSLVGTISRCHGAFHLLVARTGMDTVSRTQ